MYPRLSGAERTLAIGCVCAVRRSTAAIFGRRSHRDRSLVPVLAGPRAPWDPGCEPGVLGRRWSAPPQDRLMKAPLIERTAVPDTFCLFYVNNFIRGSILARLAVVRSR